MLAGENIYRTDDIKPFTYPPFFALPFVIFHWIPDTLDRTVWYFLTMAATIHVIVMLARLLAPYLTPVDDKTRSARWLFWLVVALLSGRHIAAVFENQSHDMIVAWLVMLAVYAGSRTRNKSAGAAAGAGAACKATPGLFLPVFIWQRRWKAAALFIVALVGLTLLPDLLFPMKTDSLWVIQWFHTFLADMQPGETANVDGAWMAWNKLNQNLAGTLYRLTTPIDQPVEGFIFDVSLWQPSAGMQSVITYTAQFTVLVSILFSTRPSLARNTAAADLPLLRLSEGAVIVCGMVLLSPMSSKSHFCVLLLPIAFCTADLFYRRWSWPNALLLLTVFISGSMTSKGLLGKELGDQLLARGTVTLCSLALLLASMMVIQSRFAAHGTGELASRPAQAGR